jgi:hypothetical protein
VSKETSPNLKSRGSPPYINKKIQIHHVTLLHNQRTESASFPHCDRLDYKDLVLGYKTYPITNHRTYPLMSSDQGNKNSTWAKTQRWKSAIVYCLCLTAFPWFNPDINSTSMQPCLSQVETCWICTVWRQEEELPSLKTLAPFFALPVQQDPAWVNNRRQELDFMGLNSYPNKHLEICYANTIMLCILAAATTNTSNSCQHSNSVDQCVPSKFITIDPSTGWPVTSIDKICSQNYPIFCLVSYSSLSF